MQGKAGKPLQQRLNSMHPDEAYTWDDKGAGKLFSDIFKQECRYNATAREWMAYNGKCWEIDDGGMRASKRAKELADALLVFCTSITDERRRGQYTKYVAQFGRFGSRETMLKDARSENFITQADLDGNLNLLNCQNGTLELDSGHFREHRAEDLLSKVAGAYYDPDADCKRFRAFVSEIMQADEAKTLYLQKLLGYCLTADTDLESCWILYGESTRNGKSTLVETICFALGDYALTAPPEVLALKKNKDSRNASGDIARLDGARFLSVPEPPKRMLLDVATLKTLTGRDTIVARRLYQSEFEFVPVFKLIISTNFLPVVPDDSLFRSGRVNVIPFTKHFSPKEQDTGLKAKLRQREEVSGILNWCLDGLRLYRETGLTPPPAVVKATDAYRESSDKLGLFLADTMLKMPGACVGAGEAYRRYNAWCSDNGFGVDSKASFFDGLKSKSMYAPTGTVNGKTTRNVLVGYDFIDEV